MTRHRNILWIMCDQLRWDYLSCAGHKTLQTPNIDRLAARGVRFTNTYVQSPVCGPSRMSAYTGRYMKSHGATQNRVPLRIGEPVLGDHLREAGMDCALIGKTHMVPDRAGMARLGISPETPTGRRINECGFDAFDRDDGVHPSGFRKKEPAYSHYLRERGFTAENPWEFWANSAESVDGSDLSGWLLAHADKPARVPAEHSETAYMTNRAMEFMAQAKDTGRPWCAHLSFIKPHWPYIAPAPYHDMYGPEDIPPAVRSDAEKTEAHPLHQSFARAAISENLSRDEVRDRVIPAYMGLIKQIDDELGRLFAYMEQEGLDQNTMIVFTSDHGDYLGDHWLGEKYLFHDASAKVPMIVYDPSPEADTTRGTTSDALVEMIDMVPTFLDYAGGEAKPHILEGLSLLPLLHDAGAVWPRRCAFSELDFSNVPARVHLDREVHNARVTMAFDGRYKLCEVEGHRPILFDLQEDPDELCDLAEDPASAPVISRLIEEINQWHRGARARITKTDASYRADDHILRDSDPDLHTGVPIGYWDEAQLEAAKTHLEQVRKAGA